MITPQSCPHPEHRDWSVATPGLSVVGQRLPVEAPLALSSLAAGTGLQYGDAGAAVEQEHTQGVGVRKNAEGIQGDNTQSSNGIYYRARKHHY